MTPTGLASEWRNALLYSPTLAAQGGGGKNLARSQAHM